MTDHNFRLASYNIRKARGLDNKRLPERTLKVINGLDADVVVLQEADLRLGSRKPALSRELIASETDFELVEVSKNGTSLGWHGNAVLKRSNLKVTGFERIDLPGLEPRGAVRVSLDLGGQVDVIGTHLGLRRRNRKAQTAVLRGLAASGRHTVIAGDFNEWSAKKGLEELEQEFELLAPGLSFHARRPIAALDRIAISPGLDCYDGGVDDGETARRASDHLPIWADLSVRAAHHLA